MSEPIWPLETGWIWNEIVSSDSKLNVLDKLSVNFSKFPEIKSDAT